MQGYLGMPDLTVGAWRNFRFHSGDFGYLTEDGYLYFAERSGDRIRRRAENVSAYDIESAAAGHPGVWDRSAAGVSVRALSLEGQHGASEGDQYGTSEGEQ